jgi:hypothetical protein
MTNSTAAAPAGVALTAHTDGVRDGRHNQTRQLCGPAGSGLQEGRETRQQQQGQKEVSSGLLVQYVGIEAAVLLLMQLIKTATAEQLPK